MDFTLAHNTSPPASAQRSGKRRLRRCFRRAAIVPWEEGNLGQGSLPVYPNTARLFAARLWRQRIRGEMVQPDSGDYLPARHTCFGACRKWQVCFMISWAPLERRGRGARVKREEGQEERRNEAQEGKERKKEAADSGALCDNSTKGDEEHLGLGLAQLRSVLPCLTFSSLFIFLSTGDAGEGNVAWLQH